MKTTHVCARSKVIGNGVPIGVSEMAREAGIGTPVALTEAVWRVHVAVPGEARPDWEERLWNILWMLRAELDRCFDHRDELLFEVLERSRDKGRARPVTLKSVSGTDEDGEPVIAVMLPEED